MLSSWLPNVQYHGTSSPAEVNVRVPAVRMPGSTGNADQSPSRRRSGFQYSGSPEACTPS